MMDGMEEVIIVGAGPYGLSIAAHLGNAGVPYRIFGQPLVTWREHMPKGMLLKSEGYASRSCPDMAATTSSRRRRCPTARTSGQCASSASAGSSARARRAR